MYQQNYGGNNMSPANMNNYYNNAYGPTSQPQYPNYGIRDTQPNATPMYTSPMSNQFLKGRPVSSFEEARAAQIDFDGSLHVFTDIGNKKIYTKQINLDGTATLNTYTLVEQPEVIQPQAAPPTEYVTREEFNQVLSQLQTIVNSIKAPVVNNKSKTLNDF